MANTQLEQQSEQSEIDEPFTAEYMEKLMKYTWLWEGFDTSISIHPASIALVENCSYVSN